MMYIQSFKTPCANEAAPQVTPKAPAMATNYASILGIQNKWAPIVFAVIYFLVMLWYLVQAARRHAWVYGALALFSALRVVSFSLRAAIASNHHNDAFNRQMAIAYEVLYNVGYFSILLSAYRLLHDRRWMAKINSARNKGRSSFPYRVMGGLHKGRFMELLLLLSVILGAVGVSYALGTNVGRTKLGNRLNDASTYIFLAATVIILLSTLLVVHLERSLATQTPVGSPLQHAILLFIALLLLLRILFYAATASNSIKQTAQGNEHLWYPLAALAELLVVLLFLAPGLVPLRSMVMRHRRNIADPSNEKGSTTGAGYNAGDNAATGGLGAADNAHTGMNAV
ncbi:hypothetical protein DFH08DRAFT_773207 [Mycena albidolilacea]|uniref:DUF7702 domain-containing protein n=1 Tax=Mycena albidolilacea TaxID=1033008 RepID=A0AAD7AF29_9AGAR|nr:hypothetical protein DFH08DRAFT_773207 [Mycena albidolilacea]